MWYDFVNDDTDIHDDTLIWKRWQMTTVDE